MPIVNRSKIRPDILKIFDEYQKISIRGILKYLRHNKDIEIEFLPLWEKIMRFNTQYLKKQKSREELYNSLSRQDILFLAKILRVSFEFIADMDHKKKPIPNNVKLEKINAGGVPIEWQIVPNALKNHILLYIHGGGFITGSPKSHRLFTIELGYSTKMRVLSVEYRLAPENVYPASLEDCITVYKWLLSIGINPEKIIVAGDSAGGNLTLSMLIKLRNEQIPLPAGAILLSPVLDLTHSDELFYKNAETDIVLAELGLFWWTPAYLSGADPKNPLVSPLFSDLKGLPPLLFQTSTSEMLYRDTIWCVEKAKVAGVNITLQEWDDMPHVFQAFGRSQLPEAIEAIIKIRQFVHKLLPSLK